LPDDVGTALEPAARTARFAQLGRVQQARARWQGVLFDLVETTLAAISRVWWWLPGVTGQADVAAPANWVV
jgi:hypothetical protein